MLMRFHYYALSLLQTSETSNLKKKLRQTHPKIPRLQLTLAVSPLKCIQRRTLGEKKSTCSPDSGQSGQFCNPPQFWCKRRSSEIYAVCGVWKVLLKCGRYVQIKLLIAHCSLG